MANTNTNTDRAVLKQTIDSILIKLNNYLMVSDLKQRYVLEWKKGEKTIVTESTKQISTHYYTLSLNIQGEDGEVIGVYGAHYPIDKGTSIIRVFEAELRAYKDLLTHGIGTMISVQHSMFLQLRDKEEKQMEQNNVEK